MEELELGQYVMGKKLSMSDNCFTHAQEMQRQMEELELGQHGMGKKLSMSDNCFLHMRRRCSVRWRSWSWDST